MLYIYLPTLIPFKLDTCLIDLLEEKQTLKWDFRHFKKQMSKLINFFMNSRFSLFSVVIQSFIIRLRSLSFCGRLAIQDTRPDGFYKQTEIFECAGTWITFLQFIWSNKEFTIFTPDLQSVKGKKLQEKKNEINAHHDHVKAVAELKGLEM